MGVANLRQLMQAPAPVQSARVVAVYHMLRLIVGLAIGAALAIGVVAWSLPGVTWLAAPGGLLVAADGAYRRLRPGASLPASMMLDTTVLGLGVYLVGGPAVLFALPLSNLVAASFLLLPFSRAIAVLGYGALWAVADTLLLGTAQISTQGWVLGTVLLAACPLALAFLVVVGVQAFHEARRNASSALETERRANELKEQFVSMISHELRTPLTGIAGFADTLQNTWESLDPVEVKEFLSIINHQSVHLTRLVEDVLLIPRLEAGRVIMVPEVFNPRQLVDQLAAFLFTGDDDPEVEVIVDPQVEVLADYQRVQQVLRNLMENAAKYGGDQILIESVRSGSKLKIVVADTGPGIPEEARERIFGVFEQLAGADRGAEQGIGLGLPIARQLVRAMGGELWHEPRFPTGSRFCFTLDLAPPPPLRKPGSAVGKDTPLSVSLDDIEDDGILSPGHL